MSNMSYCRFRNTASDLSDCQDALEEILAGSTDALSYDELRAAKKLAEHCQNILSLLMDAQYPQPDDALDFDFSATLDSANVDCARFEAAREGQDD